MRTIVVAIVTLVLAVPAMAKMPLTIGAGSTGYGATVEDKGAHFTNYWMGMRGLGVSEKTAVYLTYQHVGMNGGEGGDGLKALLVSGAAGKPWYLMTDIGVAFDLAAEADGSNVAAFTAGGGFSLAMTEYISPFIYASAYDAGDRFSWAIHIGMAVTDIQAIVLKKGK